MTLKDFLATVTAMIILTLFACTTPAVEEEPIDTAAVKEDMVALETQYAEAENSRNAEGVAAMYADDARSFPPNQDPLSGADGILAGVKARMAADSSQAQLTLAVDEVFAAGDYVTTVGSWSVKMPDGTEIDKGHYMSLIEMQDSTYKIIRNVWNSTTPLSTPMADAQAEN